MLDIVVKHFTCKSIKKRKINEMLQMQQLIQIIDAIMEKHRESR